MHEIHSNNKKIHVCRSLKKAKQTTIKLCNDSEFNKEYNVVHNGKVVMTIKNLKNNESRFR